QVDALQVEIDLAVPGLFVQVHRPAIARAADIVDQDVDPPPLVQAGAHQLAHGVRGRDVGAPAGDLAAGFAPPRHGFRHRGLVQVHGEYARAFLREPIGDGAAIAPAGAHAARAGHDCDLALQASCHVV